MQPFLIFSTLFLLAGIACIANDKWLRLPNAIALLTVSLLVSAVVYTLDLFGLPTLVFSKQLIQSIDLKTLLVESLLSFILFAMAIRLDSRILRNHLSPIIYLATVGVIVSTLVVGFSLWGLGSMFDVHVPIMAALLFGAIISPTDPVSIISIVGRNDRSPWQNIIVGESLVNDATALLLFTLFLQLATTTTNEQHISLGGAITFFIYEVGIAVLIGIVFGSVGIAMLRAGARVPEGQLLMMIGIAAGSYSLTEILGASAPLCTITAGLIIGHFGSRLGISEGSRAADFWLFIDHAITSVLFLLIGLEILTISWSWTSIVLGLIAFVAVVFARFIAVMSGHLPYRLTHTVRQEFVLPMTWGAMRGGVSVALALGLPDAPWRNNIVVMTYVVVIASTLGQGLTIKPLVGLTESWWERFRAKHGPGRPGGLFGMFKRRIKQKDP